MPTNIGAFLKAVKTEIEIEGFKQFQLFKKSVTGTALTRVVQRTPVDTGRLKGNWLVGINSIPGGFDENKFDKNGSSTISEGKAVIDNSSGIFDDIFIVDNTPYMGFVHDGTPKMAARPWVEAVAAELDLEVLRI